MKRDRKGDLGLDGISDGGLEAIRWDGSWLKARRRMAGWRLRWDGSWLGCRHTLHVVGAVTNQSMS